MCLKIFTTILIFKKNNLTLNEGIIMSVKDTFILHLILYLRISFINIMHNSGLNREPCGILVKIVLKLIVY